MKAHRVPVLAAGRARARVDPLADLVGEDVGPIARLAGLGIEVLPHVLEDRLDVPFVRAGLPIVLPQHAVLADREHPALATGIDEDALEDVVQIERFAGRVLVIPGELAGGGVERHRGARVQRRIVRRHAATGRHPRLGLRGAPIGEIQLGVVAPGDPRLAAGTIEIRQRAPGIAARLAAPRDRAEAPALLLRFPGRRR